MTDSETGAESGLVEKLLSSFCELEGAIESARAALAKKQDVPVDVFDRLDSYDRIIGRQKRLAQELRSHIETGDISEIMRHVGLINNLSGMIIDDARAILMSFQPEAENDHDLDVRREKINFC